jgi:hypothetical protein
MHTKKIWPNPIPKTNKIFQTPKSSRVKKWLHTCPYTQNYVDVYYIYGEMEHYSTSLRDFLLLTLATSMLRKTWERHGLPMWNVRSLFSNATKSS